MRFRKESCRVVRDSGDKAANSPFELPAESVLRDRQRIPQKEIGCDGYPPLAGHGMFVPDECMCYMK